MASVHRHQDDGGGGDSDRGERRIETRSSSGDWETIQQDVDIRSQGSYHDQNSDVESSRYHHRNHTSSNN